MKGSGIIAFVDLCPKQEPVLANQIYRLQRHSVGSLKVIIGHAVTCLGTLSNRARMSHTSKTMQTWILLTTLLHYGQHCARFNHNYAIIAFLWLKSAYAVLPDPSAGRLAHETSEQCYMYIHSAISVYMHTSVGT